MQIKDFIIRSAWFGDLIFGIRWPPHLKCHTLYVCKQNSASPPSFIFCWYEMFQSKCVSFSEQDFGIRGIVSIEPSSNLTQIFLIHITQDYPSRFGKFWWIINQDTIFFRMLLEFLDTRAVLLRVSSSIFDFCGQRNQDLHLSRN